MQVEGSRVEMFQLREALEASWKPDTAYLKVEEAGNPALGQCYPTSWVVQFYYPKAEIVEGEIWTGKSTEKHFWNILGQNGETIHIDFTWQQFPNGSVIKSYKVRDRETLGDGPETIKRIELLHNRVKDYLSKHE